MSSNFQEADLAYPFGERIRSGRADSILASIFQGMREQFNITPIRFNSLTIGYINRMGKIAITGDIPSYRGNLERAIRKPRLTWSQFLRVLAVLNIQEFEFAIVLEDENKRLSRSAAVIDLRRGADVEEAQEALARLFKQILEDIKMGPDQFWELLDRYVRENRPTATPVEMQNFRGHLKKELLKKKISWSVFVKGLIFLELPAFRIELKLTHFSNALTIHHQDVYLSPDMIDKDLFEKETEPQ